MKKIISLIIVCTIIISGMFIYGKSDKKDVLEDNNGPIIVAVIDGKASTTFPTTNKYTATVECTKNGVKQDVGAKATWNGSKWVVSIGDISAGNVRCNAIFTTRVPTLAETILANNEVKAPITTPGAAISTADEALLASAEDDNGTSYYFRGAVTNNYVEFANKCWRIVRVGGDNSVKLILHNDNKVGVANPCDAANNSTSAAFARYSGETYTSTFNENWNDNAYVGFMYGDFTFVCNDHPEITTEFDCNSAGYKWIGSSSYAGAHANTNNSTILTNLVAWYNSNLKTYESVIADTVWCNDKTNVTDTTYNPEFGETPTGLGYGNNRTYYGATQRLVGKGRYGGIAGGTGPSLKCNGELSKITSKVGLITADELALAGYAYAKSNTTAYLQENATSDYWWSLSPGHFSGNDAYVWLGPGSNSGIFSHNVGNTHGVRPSISLKSTTNVTGNGTSEKPYVVN